MVDDAPRTRCGQHIADPLSGTAFTAQQQCPCREQTIQPVGRGERD